MELAVDNFVRGNLLRLSVDNKLNAFREFLRRRQNGRD